MNTYTNVDVSKEKIQMLKSFIKLYLALGEDLDSFKERIKSSSSLKIKLFGELDTIFSSPKEMLLNIEQLTEL